MAKIRLKADDRSSLRELAEKLINERLDKKKLRSLFEQAVAATNKVLRKRFPEEDMVVLRRYSLARQDFCLRFQYENGIVDGFDFSGYRQVFLDLKNEDVPLVDIPSTRGCRGGYGGDVLTAPTKLYDLFQQYVKERERLSALKASQQTDLFSLIDATKYYEDLVDVWPSAKALSESILRGRTALTIISPDLVERIKKFEAAK